MKVEKPWEQGVKGEAIKPVINNDGGCIRVEAGPGTGKSFGLKRRVVRLLHAGGLALAPSSVLVVAFNRIIANDLRVEIAEALKSAGHVGELPRIQTLHSFCLRELGISSRVLLPHECDAMAYDLLTIKPLLRNSYKDQPALLQAVRDIQAGHKSDALLSDQIDKWLARHKALDVADVPKALLERIQAGDYEDLRFSQIVVDEFQDLTTSEQELVFNLIGKGGSILAVGDPRQSIYRFRGNDKDGLRNVSSWYGGQIYDHPLTVCVRCPKRHVDAANDTTVSSDCPRLEYGSDVSDETRVVHWKSIQAEAKGMAIAITRNYKGRENERHLVMVTRRKFGYMLRNELASLDDTLRIRMVFSESPLETWPARESFIAFCLLFAPDPPTWRAWLGYRAPKEKHTFKADKRNSECYLKLLDSTGDTITWQTLEAVADGDIVLSGVGKKNVLERIHRALAIRDEWKDRTSNFSKFIVEFFDITNWLPMQNEDTESVRNDLATLINLLSHLAEEAKDKAASEKVVADWARVYIAMRDTDVAQGDEADISITTLWSAKGVTAENVYIIGMCDEAVPGEKKDEYPGTTLDFIEEQQRLFYVSITRSKRTLVISRAKSIKVGEARKCGLAFKKIHNQQAVLTPSKFMLAAKKSFGQSMDGEEWLVSSF